MELLYIILTLLTLHYVIFVGSIYLGLIKLSRKEIEKETDEKLVSIIIPFRNEEAIILENLKSLEDLVYPDDKFEVIYVDDHSSDKSVELLNDNIKRKNFRVVQLPDGAENSANKKKAVEYGISLGMGEIIFASDADCKYNPDWISLMLKCFSKNTGFVAGPVDFETTNSFMSNIQQIEHASLILTGAGLISAGNPIICSGANISFRKDVFKEVGGYSGYADLASGDDSFLITKVFFDSSFEVNFCYDNSAMVKTRGNENLEEFLNQRKRWVGKAFFYKRKLILLQIVLLALFLISLPIQLVLGIIIDNTLLYGFIIGYGLKILLDFVVMNRGTKTLYSRKIMKWFWVTEIIHIPYTIITLFSSLFSKFSWKGRELKK